MAVQQQGGLFHGPKLGYRLINAVVSMGRRNTQVEPDFD